MTRQAGPTLAGMRAAYRAGLAAGEWRTEWAVVVLWRQPGILLAWALARLGVAPITVTGMAAAVALMMPVAALTLPLAAAAPAVAALGVLFQILDCTDGALARATGQTSAHGARVDFLTDMAQWGLLYLAIGLMADRFLGTAGLCATLAMAAAWLRLLARIANDATPRGPAAVALPGGAQGFLLAAVSGLSGLFPLLALCGPWLGIAVGFLLLYSLLDLADALSRALRAG